MNNVKQVLSTLLMNFRQCHCKCCPSQFHHHDVMNLRFTALREIMSSQWAVSMVQLCLCKCQLQQDFAWERPKLWQVESNFVKPFFIISMFELFSKFCSWRRWMVLHPSRQNKHIQALVQCDNPYLFSQACMCKQNKQTHTCNTPLTPYTDKHNLSLLPLLLWMFTYWTTQTTIPLCLCITVCVSCLQCWMFFLLVVEVIWKECSGKGGASQPLNQRGRA